MEAALNRELAEELGAKATDASQVFLFSSPSDAAAAVQHFFVARWPAWTSRPAAARSSMIRRVVGTSWTGLTCAGDDLASIDLKPTALKEFILANREALLVEATAAA